jgi:hypothetical protein
MNNRSIKKWEEGEKCSFDDCKGHLKIAYPDFSCTCFINAPCNRCTSSFYQCNECGFSELDESEYSITMEKEKSERLLNLLKKRMGRFLII